MVHSSITLSTFHLVTHYSFVKYSLEVASIQSQLVSILLVVLIVMNVIVLDSLAFIYPIQTLLNMSYYLESLFSIKVRVIYGHTRNMYYYLVAQHIGSSIRSKRSDFCM